jgi:hypothetical protein
MFRRLLVRANSTGAAQNVTKLVKGESLAAHLNWNNVLKRAAPQAQQQLIEIRHRYEELRTNLLSYLTTPSIPFNRYKSALPENSPVQAELSKLEAELDSYKEPSPNPKMPQTLDAIQAEKIAQLSESKQFLGELETDIATVKSYLERLEKLPPYDELTIDQYFDLFPEEKERIFKEIEADNWGVQKEEEGNHPAAH